MKYPNVLQAKPAPDYTIILTYENGKIRTSDIKPYICGEWFGKLKNPEVFNTVRPCGNTVEWIDGQDIAPHELYDLSQPC